MFLTLQAPTTTPGFLGSNIPFPLLFYPPSNVIRHPPPLKSSLSQPSHTLTRVMSRPDRYSQKTSLRLPCLVTYIVLCVFCFTAVFASSLLLFGEPCILTQCPAQPSSHTSFRIFVFLQQSFTASMLFLPLPFPAAFSEPLPGPVCFLLTLLSLCLSSLLFVQQSSTCPTALALVFIHSSHNLAVVVSFRVNCSERHL